MSESSSESQRAKSASRRILVIGGATDNLQRFRGTMLKTFVAMGHEVHTCAGETDEPTIRWLNEQGIEFHPVSIQRRGLNPLSDLSYLRQLRGVIRRCQPDTVLAYTIKPMVYGCIAAHREGVSTIAAMLTGAGMAFSEGSLSAMPIRWLITRLLRRGLKHAQVVLFQNPDDIELFRKLGVIRDQCVVLINGSGVDMSFFSAGPPPTDPPTFLLMARLIPEKGVREFAQAAAVVKRSCPEARFQLLGPYEEMRARITQEEVNRWEAECGVEYLGVVRDVRPCLKEASVYVLPSYYREGQPRSILEAMAMGRPIITADSAGCRETVDEGVNGFLVPPRNSEALAEAMLRFINNRSLIIRHGAASRRLAEQKYDVHKVNAVINEALGLQSPKLALSPT